MECTLTFEPHVFPPENYETIPSDFIRIPSFSFPSSTATEVSRQFSSFISLKLFSQNTKVPVINCRRGDVPRCGTCQSYLSPFVNVSEEYRSWRCPLCGHLNSTIMFTSLYDMKLSFDRQELHNLVYDILPPKRLCFITGKPRVFLFIVDEWLLSTNGSYERMMKAFDSVEKVIKKDDLIGLIVFSSAVTLVDLTNSASQAFSEFEPETFINEQNFFVRAEVGFKNLVNCIKSLGHQKQFLQTLTYSALQWAVHLMKGLGGRILMFTSGRCTEEPLDLLNILHKRSISISLFKTAPIRVLENWAMHTGGFTRSFGELSSLAGIFRVQTAWDTALSIRLSSETKCTSIYGNGMILDNGVFSFPIATSEQSYFFEIKTDIPSIKNFYFQFAIRFTDNMGTRIIRIVNGMVPFTDIVRFPIDEAAISMFLLRKRYYESNEKLFNSRVELTKNLVTQGTKLPELIYGGTLCDCPFLNDVTVERFAMSIFTTEADFGHRKLLLVWTPSMIIAYPEPTDEEQDAILRATWKMGIIPNVIFSAKSQKDFESMVNNERESKRWYSEISGFILK